MREITDEEVLSTELHITVEQYLRLIDKIEDAILEYLGASDKCDELEEVRQKFKALFRVIRVRDFERFRDAIVKGSGNYDAKIN